MIKIKLSTPNPDFPLIRQTPNTDGTWGNYKFFINQEIEECDYWVVFDGLGHMEHTKCPKENVILITGEPPSVKEYSNWFIRQFHILVTCHNGIRHKNAIFKQQGLPWMAGATYLKNEKKWDSNNFISYNDFKAMDSLLKTKELSIILSNKKFTAGHEQRIRFLERLEETFGNRIDIFGRGFNEIEDKIESIIKYKYTIVLENSSFRNYWTEKLSDAYLCSTFPFYYGCLNILDYFPKDSLAIIDIYDIEESIKIIKSVMESKGYEKSLYSLKESKELVLNQYNLFPSIVNIIENIKKNSDESDKKGLIKLYPERRYRKLVRKIAGSFLPKIRD
jgi:hypothetical protein